MAEGLGTWGIARENVQNASLSWMRMTANREGSAMRSDATREVMEDRSVYLLVILGSLLRGQGWEHQCGQR